MASRKGVPVFAAPMRFTLIDRIVELEPGARIKAIKALSMAEEYLGDHFPLFPVLPGVLMLEALTQAGAWLVRSSEDFAHSLVVLKEARNVKYADFVEPGRILTVTVEITKWEPRLVHLKAQGTLDGVVALSAARLVLELDHLDCSIRIFEPEIDFVDMPVRMLPPPNAAFRGEFQRSLLEMLRGNQHWQTTDDLTVKVMIQRRMNENEMALRVLTRRRVGHALKRLKNKGVVACRKAGAGSLLSWRITKPDANLEGGWRNGSS